MLASRTRLLPLLLMGATLATACGSKETGGAAAGTTTSSTTSVNVPGALVSGQNNPGTVAVNSTNVFWVNEGNASVVGNVGSVRRCPKTGCGGKPILVAQLAPNTPQVLIVGETLAVDETNVYFGTLTQTQTSSSGQVLKCPVAGCFNQPTTLAKGVDVLPVGMAVDATNVYWADFGGSVKSCAIAGCGGTPTTIAAGLDQPLGIATDGTNVYWIEQGGNVGSCPVAGCGGSPTVLATGQNPQAMAIDAQNVYWTNLPQKPTEKPSVMKCAKGGCGGVPVPFSADESFPQAIVADGTKVYWIQDPLNEGVAEIRECPASGCAPAPTVVYSDKSLVYPVGLAMDDQFLYWSETFQGAIHQTPR